MPQRPQEVNFIGNSALGVGPIVPLSATSITLSADQAGKYLRTTSGSSTTVTVPKDSNVPIPISRVFNVCQAGAGVVTFAPAGGVTINSAGGLLAIAARYGVVSLIKVAEDTWDLCGNLA